MTKKPIWFYRLGETLIKLKFRGGDNSPVAYVATMPGGEDSFGGTIEHALGVFLETHGLVSYVTNSEQGLIYSVNGREVRVTNTKSKRPTYTVMAGGIKVTGKHLLEAMANFLLAVGDLELA